ncbi:MAG: hypothetical protein VKK59_00590 [Vampirovibrionales bacterium]|nr:hypothetical protein [Vampirovibrionales bacterium]
MSDTAAPEKSVTLEKTAPEKPKAPEKPAEKPFNTDALDNCTSRFNRFGWNVFLSMRNDRTKIETAAIRARVTTPSAQSAQRLAHALQAAAATPQLTIRDAWFEATTTFLALQSIVKDADVQHIEVVAL